ncbi:MAG TPA: LamG-like jellyroll fold domain-containing protein, partial [Verrucomicrobiae bacterium]
YSHVLGTNEMLFSQANGPDVYVAPPAQASNLGLGTNSNRLILTWTPGAGSAGSLVVMSAGQAGTQQPNYGTSYAGNPIFGSGPDLGGGNFVVFAGSGNTVTVTNLTPGVRYYATVYAYNGSGTGTVLNLADAPTANQLAAGVVQSLTLTVPTQIPLGATAQAVVTAGFAGGSPAVVTGSAGFASSAPGVVTVSTNGVLTAVGYGTANVSASFQGWNVTNPVTVVNPLITNLRHRYPFLTDASDVVGTATGTLQGGATVVNGQLILDGAAGYVSLPTGIVAGYSNITLEVWVTNTVAATWSRIFDIGSSTTANMFLTPQAGSGTLRYAITIAGNGSEQQVNTAAALPLNVKKHVVLTQNGTTAILYVDGVAVGTNTAMTLNPAALGSSTANYLGKSQYADPYFAGSLDEFRIYDTALPASMVLSNYLAGPNGLAIAPPTSVNDNYAVNRGGQILLPVLANDTGPAAVAATLKLVTTPLHGTAVVNTNTGKILYTHDGSATLSDAFTYQVQGVTGATSAVATVSLSINYNLRLPATTLAMPNAPP